MIWYPRSAKLAILFLSLSVGAISVFLWLRAPAPDAPPPELPPPALDEASLLAESHGLVARREQVLTFHLKSGEVLTLTDRRRCGDLECPAALAVSYRYQGWDERIGGYRLQLGGGGQATMVLTYGEDEPILVDPRHNAESMSHGEPMPMPGGLPPAVPTDPSVADWLADLRTDRDQTEKTLLADATTVVRDEAGLVFTLSGQRHLRLEDDLVCGQVACPPQISRSYAYMGASPDRRYQVVRVEGNETESGLLIGRDGGIQETLSVPVFSPDGAEAVAVISDLEARAPRRLEVWHLADDKPVLTFSVPARDEDDTVYELVDWVDSHHLRLKRGPWGGDRRTAVMLVQDRTGWHIEEGDGAR